MNISSNVSYGSIDPGQQVGEFWWSMDFETGMYSCSNLFLQLCGIEVTNFTAEDLLSRVYPSHKNRIEQSLTSFGVSGFFEEKFRISTKNGYRWIHAKLNPPVNDAHGNSIASGIICLRDDQGGLMYREIESKSRFNELISRYNSV